ncbi:MAG TPA: HlyD family secretion protein [Terriglobales bacterium]|jgi:membrane fusion protein (multidrug efflux system)|nr:HlyD family secretion protein [Terriglobales bacterium]
MPELELKPEVDEVVEERVDDTPLEQPIIEKKSFFAQHPQAKWIILAAAVVVLLGGIGFWMYYSVRESTDDAQIEGYVVPIAPRVSGTVISVNVNDNQPVKPDDLLVQLDPRDYEVAMQKAEGDLADALSGAQAARTGVPIASITYGSQLSITQANLMAAQKEVDSAEATLRQAAANYSKAADDLKRYQQLITRDEISQQQFDAAVTNEKAARAAVDAAQAGVVVAQSHVRQAQAQVAGASTAPDQVLVSRAHAGSAEGLVQTRTATLEQAKLNLEYTTIRAAVGGVVTNKQVQIGQVVQTAQPLMALVPLDDIWVVANYKEDQIKNMRVGQPVTIHVDAYNRDYNGHVDSFSAATASKTSLLPAENATGNYVKVVQRIPVKIRFEKGQDPQHILRPGMSAVPTVLTNK